MRPSTTSVLLALRPCCAPPGLGPGSAAVRRGQGAAAPRRRTERREDDPSKPPASARRSSSPPRSARRPSRTFPASVTVVGGQLHGAAAGRRLPGPRAAGAGPERRPPPGRASPASPCAASTPAASRPPIGVYFDDVPFGSSSGLANAAIVVRRLRHVRRRAGRSAARPPGHPVRSELARRRHEVRAEPAQHREVRGAVHGKRGGRRQRRPRLLPDGARERAARRQGRGPGQRVLSLRQRLHRLDRQQPDPQPHEPGGQRHRRHARRGGPQLARPVRRALRRCCSSPPTSSR